MSTMLYILGVALVVFVFLGSVRRPEFLRRRWGPVPERAGAPPPTRRHCER